MKKIDPDLAVSAIGKIGCDAEGEFVTDILKAGGVSTTGLAVMPREKTTFTEVMSVVGGQRTFFVYPGAGADFGIADMDFDAIHAKILHLGYFLLLQKVDDGDGLKILQKAEEVVWKPPLTWSAKIPTGIAWCYPACPIRIISLSMSWKPES